MDLWRDPWLQFLPRRALTPKRTFQLLGCLALPLFIFYVFGSWSPRPQHDPAHRCICDLNITCNQSLVNRMMVINETGSSNMLNNDDMDEGDTSIPITKQNDHDLEEIQVLPKDSSTQASSEALSTIILEVNPNLEDQPSSTSSPFINMSLKESLSALFELQNTSVGPSTRLLDIPNFTYNIANSGKCILESGKPKPIYLMIMIHSEPINFEGREAIRSTWGKPKSIYGRAIDLIFLLGQIDDNDDDNEAGNLSSTRIYSEAQTFGDMVIGNFKDDYQNMSYKHLMGYKWIHAHCPQAQLVLKADDDAFVDIFSMIQLLLRNFGPKPKGFITCTIHYNEKEMMPERSNTSRWYAPPEIYPMEFYPAYCGGLGYIITPDIIEVILSVSSRVKKFLWLDDLFYTGILVALAEFEVSPYRRIKEFEDFDKFNGHMDWLRDMGIERTYRKFPSLISHIRRDGILGSMKGLWKRVLRSHFINEDGCPISWAGETTASQNTE